MTLHLTVTTEHYGEADDDIYLSLYVDGSWTDRIVFITRETGHAGATISMDFTVSPTQIKLITDSQSAFGFSK